MTTSGRSSADNSNFLKYPFIEYSLDIYNIKASQILTLSRDTINDKEFLLDKLEEMLESLELAITENKFDISTMISDPSHLSLFLNLFNEDYDTEFLTTNKWKDLRVSADYTIADILNFDSFTVAWNPATIKQLSDEMNISNHIDSEILKYLVVNSSFVQKTITNNGFHSYIFEDVSHSGSYSVKDTLYSKTAINNDKFKDVSLLWSDDHNDDSYCILDSVFDLENHPFIFYKIEPLLPAKEFFKALFSDSNNFTHNDLFFIRDDEKTFLFPYIEDNGMVIEVSNIMLFNLIDALLEISFEEFDKLYNEIKKQILNKAKSGYPNWYKAYERGQSFRSIDLSSLDELHKPSA